MTGETNFINIIDTINENFVWGLPMLLLFIGSGIYFSVKHKFFQLNIPKLFRETLFSREKSSAGEKSLSPFQTLTASLAATLGTGNIVALGTAIALGGAGAVFWMWASALLGMATCYAENRFGMLYRKKRKDGSPFGGAFFYIEAALGKGSGRAFAILCVLSALGMGNLTQINALSGAMEQSFSIKPEISGIVSTVLVGIFVFGGAVFLGKVTEKAVPIISAAYILGCLAVIFINIGSVPEVMGRIFAEAFGLNAIGGGIAGSAVMTAVNAMSWGLRRGVFSNEAGLGSSVMLHASSSSEDADRQGKWAALTVFFDTLVICTLTALAILLSGADKSGVDGTKLAVVAFSNVFGDYAGGFVAICIFLFAISTAAGWAVYGGSCAEYLWGKRAIKPFMIFFTLITFFGATMELTLVWALADMVNGLMAIPNLTAILKLSIKRKKQ